MKTLVVLAVGVALGVWGLRKWQGWTNQYESTQTVVRPSSSVVRAVRELGRLEAVTFHIERVVDLRKKEKALFGLMEVEDALLLVAAAEVTAGVDLRDLRAENITVARNQSRVAMVLPSPTVFRSSIDNERTFVYERHTDFFAKRHDSLEADARKRAEESARQAALQANLLPTARKSVERTLRGLLQGLGFKHVELAWR